MTTETLANWGDSGLDSAVRLLTFLLGVCFAQGNELPFRRFSLLSTPARVPFGWIVHRGHHSERVLSSVLTCQDEKMVFRPQEEKYF